MSQQKETRRTKPGKRGADLPWVKPGHNGAHPDSTAATPARRREESGRR